MMSFETRLNDAFEEMMAYREAVGYATATYRSTVPPFINYCIQKYPESEFITHDMVDGWLDFYPYSNNGKAAFVTGSHVYSPEFPPALAQIIELHVVAAVFEMLKNQAFNLCTISQYITHGLKLLETVPYYILLILKFCNYLCKYNSN